MYVFERLVDATANCPGLCHSVIGSNVLSNTSCSRQDELVVHGAEMARTECSASDVAKVWTEVSTRRCHLCWAKQKLFTSIYLIN